MNMPDFTSNDNFSSAYNQQQANSTAETALYQQTQEQLDQQHLEQQQLNQTHEQQESQFSQNYNQFAWN